LASYSVLASRSNGRFVLLRAAEHLEEARQREMKTHQVVEPEGVDSPNGRAVVLRLHDSEV
jgi:hypothetical protein